ncbi:MAG: type II secretion system minor pseudopilin GspH [Hafnia sp.]
MKQRGFTLLEMMLVVLLMGSAASLVVMSFPPAQKNSLQQQLERFQAQLDFALDASQQNGQLLGIQVGPGGWEYKILRPQPSGNDVLMLGADVWQGFVWQTWLPGRTALGGKLSDDARLELQFAGLQKWPRENARAAEPDILLLPGGEVTPFTLLFRQAGSDTVVWLRVDNTGAIDTSEEGPTT